MDMSAAITVDEAPSVAAVDGPHRAAACFHALVSVLQSPLTTFVAARRDVAPPLSPEAEDQVKNLAMAGLNIKLQFMNDYWQTHFSTVAPKSLLADMKVLCQILFQAIYTANTSLATYVRGIAAVERVLEVVEADAEALKQASSIKMMLQMDELQHGVMVETPRQRESSLWMSGDLTDLLAQTTEPGKEADAKQRTEMQGFKVGAETQESVNATVPMQVLAETVTSEQVVSASSLSLGPVLELEEVNSHEGPDNADVAVVQPEPNGDRELENLGEEKDEDVGAPTLTPQLQAMLRIESKVKRRKALKQHAQQLMVNISGPEDAIRVLTLALALANSKEQRVGMLLQRMEWSLQCGQHDLARQDALAAKPLLKIKSIDHVKRLATGLVALKQWHAAREVYEQGLAKYPQDRGLRAGMCVVLQKKADLEATTKGGLLCSTLCVSIGACNEESGMNADVGSNPTPFSTTGADQEDQPRPTTVELTHSQAKRRKLLMQQARQLIEASSCSCNAESDRRHAIELATQALALAISKKQKSKLRTQLNLWRSKYLPTDDNSDKASNVATAAKVTRIVETRLSNGFVGLTWSKYNLDSTLATQDDALPNRSEQNLERSVELPLCQEAGMQESETSICAEPLEKPIEIQEMGILLEQVTSKLGQIQSHPSPGPSTAQADRRSIVDLLVKALDRATTKYERCAVFTLSAECQLAFGFRKLAFDDATAALECNEATVAVETRLAQLLARMEYWGEAAKACDLGLAQVPEDESLLELRASVIAESTAWASGGESAPSSGILINTFEEEKSVDDDVTVTSTSVVTQVEGVSVGAVLAMAQVQAIMAIESKTTRREALLQHARYMKGAVTNNQEDAIRVLSLALALANSKQQRIKMLLDRMEWSLQCGQHDLARQDALAAKPLLKIKNIDHVKRLATGLVTMKQWQAAHEVYELGLATYPEDQGLRMAQRIVLQKYGEVDAEGGSSPPKSPQVQQIHMPPTAADGSHETSDVFRADQADNFVAPAWDRSYLSKTSQVSGTVSHGASPDVIGSSRKLKAKGKKLNAAEKMASAEQVNQLLDTIGFLDGNQKEEAKREVVRLASAALSLATSSKQRCKMLVLRSECYLRCEYDELAYQDACAALMPLQMKKGPMLRLANVFVALKRNDEAAQAYDIALKTAPDDDELNRGKAMVLERAEHAVHASEEPSTPVKGVAESQQAMSDDVDSRTQHCEDAESSGERDGASLLAQTRLEFATNDSIIAQRFLAAQKGLTTAHQELQCGDIRLAFAACREALQLWPHLTIPSNISDDLQLVGTHDAISWGGPMLFFHMQASRTPGLADNYSAERNFWRQRVERYPDDIQMRIKLAFVFLKGDEINSSRDQTDKAWALLNEANQAEEKGLRLLQRRVCSISVHTQHQVKRLLLLRGFPIRSQRRSLVHSRKSCLRTWSKAQWMMSGCHTRATRWERVFCPNVTTIEPSSSISSRKKPNQDVRSFSCSQLSTRTSLWTRRC